VSGSGFCPDGQVPNDDSTGCVAAPVVPTLADGAPCTANEECISGACIGYFLDLDGDQFGQGAPQLTCGFDPPTGFARDGGDCCDLVDPNPDPSGNTLGPDSVHPFVVQPDSRPAPACALPFDFDCSGTQDPSPLPAFFEACDANCLVSPGPRLNDGLGDPPCGGTYVLVICNQNPDDLTCLGPGDGGLLQIQSCL
jgi:hypothetical protein